MTTLYSEKEECCGCTACKSICPVNSITMQPDEEGFLYPIIDDVLCVECGLCKTVCPLKNEVKFDRLTNKEGELEPLIYAIKHKSDNVRMASSSGGAYTAISDHIIDPIVKDSITNKVGFNSSNCSGNNNGCSNNSIIYGVRFSKDFNVHHASATTAAERDQFRGSKYVQSDLRNIFVNIRNNLLEGKTVLFTGTPCQTAGLYSYLKKLKFNKPNTNLSGEVTDRLILNDLICHGTPSPLLWKEYLKFIQEKHRSAVKSYSFRYKGKGWRNYTPMAVFENGKSRIDKADIMVYSNLFQSLLAHRPSCYRCKFANLRRTSDITIGDFWGIENSLPKFEDENGVSVMMINTLKGQAIFEDIKDTVAYEKSNTLDCLQRNLIEPNKKPQNRELFWGEYFREDFNYVIKKYAGYSFTGRIRRSIINCLKELKIFNVVKKLSERLKCCCYRIMSRS